MFFQCTSTSSAHPWVWSFWMGGEIELVTSPVCEELKLHTLLAVGWPAVMDTCDTVNRSVLTATCDTIHLCWIKQHIVLNLCIILKSHLMQYVFSWLYHVYCNNMFSHGYITLKKSHDLSLLRDNESNHKYIFLCYKRHNCTLGACLECTFCNLLKWTFFYNVFFFFLVCG